MGVLWRRNLDAVPITHIDSDRICGVRIRRKCGQDDSWLSVIGVYLPCADLGLDYYRDTLTELERVISESSNVGPVVVAGDCNAHLCQHWGARASENANCQGVVLGQLLQRCKLHVPSLGDGACGPAYTYQSGSTTTTIDYIFTDIEASSCVEKCWTHEDAVLNQSDHLPLSARFSCTVCTQPAIDLSRIKIDWATAVKEGALDDFQNLLKDRLFPFVGRSRFDLAQVNNEIKHVAWLIKNAAESCLPHCHSKTFSFKDKVLAQLSTKSKFVWDAWKDSGKPQDGPLYKAKCLARREVKKRVKFCAAMEERRKVQRCEHMFKSKSKYRFKLPQRKKNQSTCLRVNGKLITDSAQLLEAWTEHFQSLGQSCVLSNDGLGDLEQHVTEFRSTSFHREETFLDMPFTEEEVQQIVERKMKLGKASGLDGLTAEHIRYGGHTIIVWLTEIFNAIIEFEMIPSVLKTGVTIPVYKGGGKDPMDVQSYRGISLNSVISKILERLILVCLEPVYSGGGIPHPNQSAYRKGVSCTDAIFATQETLIHFLQEKCSVYMCLYDLQKAFDSVEVPVLLQRLFDVGVCS